MKITPKQLFSINTAEEFNDAAIAVFNEQAKNCQVYKEFISYLGIEPQRINSYLHIPFLPIGFFKTHNITSLHNNAEFIFTSSGTTGMQQSRHLVSDISIYEQSFNLAFEKFYGPVKDICLLALLPSYQERSGSSLIYMVDQLIKQSEHPRSSYFLNDKAALYDALTALQEQKQKTVLIGVTYALLDFVAEFQIHFPELIVMETGGMKGRRKEMVREELHEILNSGFGVKHIHSEYGMTELLSQAYSAGNGIFSCPPWMKVLLRDTSDPMSLLQTRQTGGINVIDLANVNSCSFIATQDLGKLHNNGNFEVLGRFDNADIRGCNLLVQ